MTCESACPSSLTGMVYEFYETMIQGRREARHDATLVNGERQAPYTC